MDTRGLVLWAVNGAMTAAAFLLTAVRYRLLADPLPVHWGFRGEPDGWLPRRFGAWLMPGLLLGLQVFWAGMRRGVAAAPAGPGVLLRLGWTQTATSAFLLCVIVLMLDAGMSTRGRIAKTIWVAIALFVAALVGGAMAGAH